MQRWFFLLLLLLWNIRLSSSKFVPQEELLEGLQGVPYLTILLRSNEEAQNSFVRFFLTQSESPMVVSTFPDSVEAELDVDAVFLTDTAHLNETMNSYAMAQRVFFIIITDEEFDKALVVQILYDLWIRKSIYKVHILSDCGIFVFDQFYYPYGSNQSGELVAITENGGFSKFQNLNGFPVRVLIFNSLFSQAFYDKQSGKVVLMDSPDVNVALILKDKLNFKMDLLNPDLYDYGFKQPNGTFTGGMGLVIRREVDIVMTGYYVKDYSTDDIEFSVAVDSDKLCIYVQKAPQIPRSVWPILAVDKYLWAAFFSTANLSGIVWITLRMANLFLRNYDLSALNPLKDFVRLISDTWVVLVRADIVRLPSFNSERIFLISLSVVSIVFGSIFESSLSTAHIKPFHYKDLTTLKELNESGKVVYYKYVDIKNDVLEKSTLVNKYQWFNGTSQMEARNVSKESNYGALVRLNSVMPNMVQALHHGVIHIIPECIKSYRIAYILQNRSPYQIPISRVILLVMEAGLYTYWLEEIHFKNRLAILSQPKEDEVQGYTNLKLRNLQLCFYILAFGYIGGLVLFAVELYI